MTDPERPKPHSESSSKRAIYELHFELALGSLIERSEILSWTKIEPGSQEYKSGIHYVIQTEDGQVPFAISSTTDKARQNRRLFKHPVVSVRQDKDPSQLKRFITLRNNIRGCIKFFFEDIE